MVAGLGGELPLCPVHGLDDLAGSATPSNLNSGSSVPAVSKSTVPTFSSRSSADWSVFTFCTRSRRASWVRRATMPRLMCSRRLVIV